MHHGEDEDLQRQDLDVGACVTNQRAQRDAFLVAEEQAGCSRIYTYNTDHFLPLVPNGLQVTAP